MANRAIKVIKRAHHNVGEDESNRTEPTVKTDSQVRREILNTITSWIEERKLKKELSEESTF